MMAAPISTKRKECSSSAFLLLSVESLCRAVTILLLVHQQSHVTVVESATPPPPGKQTKWLGRVLGGKSSDESNDDQTQTLPFPPPPPIAGHGTTGGQPSPQQPQPNPQYQTSPQLEQPFPPPPPSGLSNDVTGNRGDNDHLRTVDVDGGTPPPPPSYFGPSAAGYWFDGSPLSVRVPPSETVGIVQKSGHLHGQNGDKNKEERTGMEEDDGEDTGDRQGDMVPPAGGQYWDDEFGQRHPLQQQFPTPYPVQQQQEQWYPMDHQYHQQQQIQQAQYEDWEGGVTTDPMVAALQSQVEAATTREADLIYRITNLTMSLSTAEDTASGRLHTIDLLTERIAETEARAASDSNAVRELTANCTDLAVTIRQLREEAGRWEAKCVALEEQKACDAREVEDLQSDIKKKQHELEDLACAIEEDRVDKERERYLEEIRQQRKKRGFFGIIFGGIFGNAYDEEEERLKAQELARSTLIHALQTERNNVDELEASLLILQTNNSAIADMVESRDNLINELNDRVAVFEEDKIVLKAALRQLRKEIKEEAPKTAKVVSDLKRAQEEIKLLRAAAQKAKAQNGEKLAAMTVEIKKRDKQINETESKMTTIATYVDQLEERLVSFGVARRDINMRERKCKELEDIHECQAKDITSLTSQVDALSEEKDEMKSLIDLLVEERTVLQKEKEKLERRARALEEQVISLKVQSDDNDIKLAKLNIDVKEWKGKLESAEKTIVSATQQLAEMEEITQRQISHAEAKLTAAEELAKEQKQKIEELYARVAKADCPAPPPLLPVSNEEVVSTSMALETKNHTCTACYPPVGNAENTVSEVQYDHSYFEGQSASDCNNITEVTSTVVDDVDGAQSPPEITAEICSDEFQHTAYSKADISNDVTTTLLPTTTNGHLSGAAIVDDGAPKIFYDAHEGTEDILDPTSDDDVTSEVFYDALESDLNAPNATGELSDSGAATKSVVTVPQVPLLTVHNSSNVTTVRSEDVTAPPSLTTFAPDEPSGTRSDTGKKLPPVSQHTLVLSRRKVPFRKTRKAFAKLTGIHGLFTPPSRPRRIIYVPEKMPTRKPAFVKKTSLPGGGTKD